jgi:uncharacterized membrane protein
MSDSPARKNTEVKAKEKVKVSGTPIPSEVASAIQAIPDPNKRMVLETYLSVTIKRHSGPLPDPETLREYELILPGCAQKIFDNSSKQLDHRIDIEKFGVHETYKQSARGQLMGFGIGIAGLASAVFSAYLGYPQLGITIATIDLVGMVGVFVVGKYLEKK